MMACAQGATMCKFEATRQKTGGIGSRPTKHPGFDLKNGNPGQCQCEMGPNGYVLAMPDAWTWDHPEIGGYPLASKL